MRQKTNMSGLISHNNPDGSSYQSKFCSEICLEESHEYAIGEVADE